MVSEYQGIKRRIEILRKADPDFRIHGSNQHKYVLNTRLTESEILAFESEHSIRLPQQYRQFLLLVGNGGAGPGYGLERLGCIYNEDWGRMTALIGQLNEVFPYDNKWNEPPIDANLPVEQQYRVQDEYWDSKQVNGAVPICHLGCNQRQMLIVKGSERGHVWFDDRADWCGLYPVRTDSKNRATFLEWYEEWLNNSLQKAGVKDSL